MHIVTGVLVVLYGFIVVYLVTGVLRSRSEPSAMLAWMLLIIFVPVIGAIFNFWLGENRTAMRAERRRRRRLGVDDTFAKWYRCNVAVRAHEAAVVVEDALRGVAETARRLTDMPVTGGGDVDVIDDSNAFHQRVLKEVSEARDNLNLLFYIWEPDESGKQVLDAVIKRARAGVACRMLLDAAGVVHVPRSFLRPAEEAGVRIAYFMPFRPTRRRLGVHLRNHRKIVVADGRIALVGSQNIGDEERGFGVIRPYHQLSLAIRGPAVNHVQAIFAGDWNAFAGETLCEERYFPVPDAAGGARLQIVATGPDRPYQVIERIMLEALAVARKEVWIATPYFVPSEPVRLAMVQASTRGVRVTIVTPGECDRAVALWAGRSFYGELVSEGVRICEFGPGMVHSKLMTVDDVWCMAGTANLDFRSFRLNFEISVLGYDAGLAAKIADVVRGYAQNARCVTAEDISNQGIGAQMLAGAARLLATQL